MSEITIQDESAVSRISVRAAVGTPAAEALGLTFGAAARRAGGLVAKIRPDEWYLIDSQPLADALDLSGFASRVDLTHGRLQIRLTGVDAARALDKLCNIDFSDHMTPNGACLGAPVAQVSCDIIRDDLDGVRSYLLMVDSSYHGYFTAALADAVQEFRD